MLLKRITDKDAFISTGPLTQLGEVLLTDGASVLLSDLVGRIAYHCAGAPVAYDKHPIFRVFLIAHWSLAEIQTFKHFRDIKTLFDSVRGTYITTGAPYEVSASLEGGARCVDVEVFLWPLTPQPVIKHWQAWAL